MSYYNEPSGEEWYADHDPEEQEQIDKSMESCPQCGEYLSKTSEVLKKNGGVCRICRMKSEGYEVS